ncbi:MULTISPECIES: hypothetical protein [unclassified Rathayibacter]|uniref:hypothetical protein n=1 Tax=unclassified Rathayibacter TaxID=2609250 RepID=UPI0015E2CBD7|nr:MULTISPECIES: hypothetical protein [unclassified Rathayibacter]
MYAWPDGQGGAHVVIDSIELGPGWAQESTWLAFSVSYLYPDADCYPHYVRADLAHADGRSLKVPFHFGNRTAVVAGSTPRSSWEATSPA